MMERKRFPMFDGGTIPWAVAEAAYEEYRVKFGGAQTLDRIAERGGFGDEELVWLLKGAPGAHP